MNVRKGSLFIGNSMFSTCGFFRALLTIPQLFASAWLEELFILFTWLVVSNWCNLRLVIQSRLLQKTRNFIINTALEL